MYALAIIVGWDGEYPRPAPIYFFFRNYRRPHQVKSFMSSKGYSGCHFTFGKVKLEDD